MLWVSKVFQIMKLLKMKVKIRMMKRRFKKVKYKLKVLKANRHRLTSFLQGQNQREDMVDQLRIHNWRQR